MIDISKKLRLALFLLVAGATAAHAQIGEHRSDFAIGANGGYLMSQVGFTPEVPQRMHGGITGGFSMRYVCEKYFKSICSIYAEVNFAQAGWKEKILDMDNNAVLLPSSQEAMAYERTINYVQVPVFAHLAWGREVKGLNFFVNLGPQFGFCLGESTKTNFDPKNMPSTGITDENGKVTNERVSNIIAQDTMAVEHKFDYGIAVGLGLEYSVPKVGHFLLEGRYYYGLGNIYGSSKRDYFGKSNFSQIVVKLSYLFDIARTKNVKRK